ncbi:MAG: DinB family protein, partial [Actinomycetota bacterium]|nr:DinB family protein [Actinomycetota bacterium]
MADDQPDGQSDRLGPTEGSLRWHLQHVRESLLATLDSLDEYDRRRPMTPSGTNLLGLVKHLAGIELEYLGVCVGRPPAVELPWVADQSIWESADMWATADESSEELIELYRGAWRHSDESIEQLGLA